LSAQTSEEPKTRRKRKAKKPHLAATFVNITGKEGIRCDLEKEDRGFTLPQLVS